MDQQHVRYPGIRQVLDGNTAVVQCEIDASDGAGAYPITPSTQMGEGWSEAAARGHLNIAGRPLIFVEPEGEHAAAAVTAGLSMSGLRATNFSSGQGIAYMHESLYAAVGKRLTYVLNIGARAITKATLNVHAGHDDYHCADDTGFFQLFAASAQQAADLNLIAHHVAELALTPGIVAQDGFLTTHLMESMYAPERELVAEFLGRAEDVIETPTAAQRMLFGATRRRIPELWNVDDPMLSGAVQNQDSYMQSVAAQRPFFFEHVRPIAEQAFADYAALTGRHYGPVIGYRMQDADYVIVGQGSMIPGAEAVADYLRETRRLKVGVVNLLMFRPFPGEALARLLQGRRGVAVLERTDQPLAEDLPLMRETRAALSKCLENGRSPKAPPFPDLPTYGKLTDLPELYSGSYGLGSRDLQPRDLIAAIENMLPEGPRRRHFYLSIDFVHPKPSTPTQAIHQEAILEAYPDVADLALHGSENPDLMPEGTTTVRLHSVGGWGMITTGKNLAMTLFDLLGYHVKANPRYGSEKKGQPTTFYLAASPEPIRTNCEYYHVDVVLSPDPNVFEHTNALAGLKEGGVLVIQSDQETPERVWRRIPTRYQEEIVRKGIRVYYLDAFGIAAEEATDADLRLRMQGIAFQGAFFATTPLMAKAGFTEESLLRAIELQLNKKFGHRGARVVADNLRTVQRGYDQVREIVDKPVGEQALNASGLQSPEPPLQRVVKQLPQGESRLGDIHRFWAQTGNFYLRGQGNDTLADPFVATGTMPPSTSLYRDMTGIRFEHPQWIPENCTACGDCYVVCPDTAIPGLVSDLQAVLDTAVDRAAAAGADGSLLRGAVRRLEPLLRTRLADVGEGADFGLVLDEAIEAMLAGAEEQDALAAAFDAMKDAMAGFAGSVTRPYFTLREKDQAGAGGLFSLTTDPYRCKGCGACVDVCGDDALRNVTQTPETVETLRRGFDFWLDLPNTPQRYGRIDDLEEAVGALHTLLLDKDVYTGFSGGDGACLGCSEKTVLHLFIATVEALMRPRVATHVQEISELVAGLEARLRDALTRELDVSDTRGLQAALAGDADGERDLTLADLAARIEAAGEADPMDRNALRRLTDLIERLKTLRDAYTTGANGRGRANLGILNATGCSSVFGSTYPYNPYPVPWSNHLFQDSPSMAMGVYEGHMAKMADGFRAVREARALLRDEPAPDLARFAWEDFTDEEFHLCPPVVAVGGDGAMYDIGFQNLSRAMMSGKPLKVLVLDTQVYSNTGGQACTSGFVGQVSDMAPFGAAQHGKTETRKEIGLIAMAHRTTWVMQSSIAHASHMIEGFIAGLRSRRPALFNLYCACQPEHGIGDEAGHAQAKLAVESRAYPLFRYDPDRGRTAAECFDLEGNPDLEGDWTTGPVTYLEGGREKTLTVPLTFADFAATEGRFRKHFRTAPPDSWHDDMLPLDQFLELDADEREGKIPFIWTRDQRGRLARLVMDEAMVASTEERLGFWTMLRDLAGVGRAEAAAAPAVDETTVRRRVVGDLANALLELLGEGEGLAAGALPAATAAPASATAPPAGAGAAAAA
ncbi:MAG: 2-oxoacid:acceptor oxidoreductase family protein, partial [Pseudomonadales bacterium]|nr:2-oxoacid:acceptor oxidoreductase family protein [Pseudomonadales bacterium]